MYNLLQNNFTKILDCNFYERNSSLHR